MHRSLVVAAAVLVSLAAPAVPLAEGEEANGFPSWAERVIHQWTNRARCDPQVEMTACGAACGDAACYSPIAPFAWSDAAGRAARFHADEMRLQGYFAHDSACTLVPGIAGLYPATCDGAASCACVDGVKACRTSCTTWSQRLVAFGLTPAWGENIEYGHADPNAAFYLWLRESSSSTTCGWSASNGHRWAILQYRGGVGAGMAGSLGVMDFTSIGTAGKVPSGAHYPKQAASVEAWANWYDVAGPSAAGVVVDDTCIAMTLERGSQTNGAWRAVLTGLETGCHRYYFAFRDSGGALVTYPTTGSLGIGDATCADFSTERPALGAGCGAVAACDPAPGGCDDGNPCTVDACEAAGCTHAAVGNGTPCGDGNACNGSETCQSAACTAGVPLACDDANPCTSDACDTATGCAHPAVPNGTTCADADACDGAETCQDGTCAVGAPLSCDDGNPCTDDACVAVAGCTHASAAAGTECSDGQSCNGPESCDGDGACLPGTTCQGAIPSEPESSGCGCGGGSGASGIALALAALAGARPRTRRRPNAA